MRRASGILLDAEAPVRVEIVTGRARICAGSGGVCWKQLSAGHAANWPHACLQSEHRHGNRRPTHHRSNRLAERLALDRIRIIRREEPPDLTPQPSRHARPGWLENTKSARSRAGVPGGSRPAHRAGEPLRPPALTCHAANWPHACLQSEHRRGNRRATRRPSNRLAERLALDRIRIIHRVNRPTFSRHPRPGVG